MKYIYIFLIIISFFSCGSVKSFDVIVKRNINTRFVIGEDRYEKHQGLWHLKDEALPDPTLKFEGNKYYSLIFRDPTDIKSNNDFIIAKNELIKEKTSYLIVKLKNDTLIRCYSTKTKIKFDELRKKLNVPDSLIFD